MAVDIKMEVYSPALELIGFLEIQRSVIWSEKAFSAGKFSVESLITAESMTMLKPENIIWIEGKTAGIIETVLEESGPNGPYITAAGPTMTGILDRRVLWGLYNLKGTAPELMNALVDDCCINPTRGDVESRKIPGLVFLDAPAGGDIIQLQETGGTLLERLETLGETYGVAFGVRFNPAVPQMEFWTRWGQNRSIHQSDNNPVLYSTELDDVLSSEYTYNSQDYRNVALVAGEGESNERVYVTVENEVEDNADVPAPNPPEPPVTQQYTVTLLVDPEGGGSVSGGKTVAAGVSVTVTASPADDYTFVEWRENGVRVSGDRQYTFTATSDRTLTAVFAAVVKVWTVTVNIDPAGAGAVTGGGSVEHGKSVTLTQTVTNGYRFSGWYNAAGGQLGTWDTYTFTPTENTTITAKYAVIPVYSITATVDPSGSGNVTGDGQYREGETVNLKATENEWYTFVDWKEGGSTVHNTADYSFTAEKNRDLVAAFKEKVSRLPAGYTELEYIQSTGTQHINTGVNPGNTTKVVIDIEPTSAENGYAFGRTYSSGSYYYRFSLYFNAPSTARFFCGKASTSDTTSRVEFNSTFTQRGTATLAASASSYTCSYGDMAETKSGTMTFSGNRSLYLLACNSDGTASTKISAKLYSCQIYTGSTLTRDFVPCKNASGTVGLYDLVGGTFYGNIGTGSFTADPAV